MLTLKYDGATYGNNEYISSIVTLNGTVTHYGRIKKIANKAEEEKNNHHLNQKKIKKKHLNLNLMNQAQLLQVQVHHQAQVIHQVQEQEHVEKIQALLQM